MDSLMVSTPQTSVPDRIRLWIDSEGGEHAMLLITVDGYLRPHVMLLARDEVAVMSAALIRVAVGERTQSAENLRLRCSATLAIYDADLACVIKSHAVRGPEPLAAGSVAYELAVEDVRFDAPTAAEASARLVTGLRFEGRAQRDDIRDRLKNL